MKTLDNIALALLIIGGLNWLLVGVADFNLVAAIFGEGSMLARIVYVIVGLAALYCIKFFSTRTTYDNRTDTRR